MNERQVEHLIEALWAIERRLSELVELHRPEAEDDTETEWFPHPTERDYKPSWKERTV